MAMSSGSGGGMLAEINVTPMVDVMLVLLIIFMVAAPMIQNGVDVQLPQARGQVMQNDEGKLILTVTKEQQVYLGKAQIASCPGRLPQDELAIGRCMDGVMTKLQTNAKLQADRELYLHADETLPYGIVVKVMAAAKAAGAEKLGMITDPLQ